MVTMIATAMINDANHATHRSGPVARRKKVMVTHGYHHTNIGSLSIPFNTQKVL
jgi:hypothetical protein